MRDNELIAIFRPIIVAGLAAQGLSDVEVLQSFQPQQQGVESGRAVYFIKLFDKRYGYNSNNTVVDPESFIATETQIQRYESTFQITALAIQDPTDLDSLTASDIVNIVSDIMQSSATVATLEENEIGILRVTEIRNPYFRDDFDRFEASPSFDFTLTHQTVLTTTPSTVGSFVPGIYRI